MVIRSEAPPILSLIYQAQDTRKLHQQFHEKTLLCEQEIQFIHFSQ